MLNITMLEAIYKWAAGENDHINQVAEALGLSDDALGSWRQDDWARAVRNGVCETAFCVAGQAVNLSDKYAIDYGINIPGMPERPGGENGFIYSEPGYTDWGQVRATNAIWVDDHNGVRVKIADPEGPSLSFSKLGAEALGITEHEADVLFEGDNDLESIWATCAAIADRHDQTWTPAPPPTPYGWDEDWPQNHTTEMAERISYRENCYL